MSLSRTKTTSSKKLVVEEVEVLDMLSSEDSMK